MSGSSTIVFPSRRRSFLPFTDLPHDEDAPAVLKALRTIAERTPGVHHLEPLRG